MRPLTYMPDRGRAQSTGLMRCTVCFLCIVFLSFAGGFSRAADEQAQPVVKGKLAADAYAEQEASLRAILRDNPDDRSALEKIALLAIERGRFREADQAYTRLLKQLLPDPAAALPIMVCKWHLLQNYEAQAGVIRAENEGKLSSGNQRMVSEWLSEIYNPESVIAAIRNQMPEPEYAAMFDNLEVLWLAATAHFSRLEESGTLRELRQYADSLFGDGAAGSFFALWRGFAHIRQKNLDLAEAALNVSALSLADSRTRLDVAAGSSLIREFRRSPLSNEVLNNLSSLLADVSSSIGQVSEAFIPVDERLDNVQKLLDARDFDAATDLLDAIYPQVANDATRRNRHLFRYSEALWGKQEFARANQGFIASAVLLRERYAVSISFQRLADYAAMQDDPERAAGYAVRSAALLRDQAWKLRETGEFFMRLNLPERGIAYFERSLDISDSLSGDADSFSGLAEAYKRIGEREQYMEYAREYVNAIEQIEELGNDVSTYQSGLRHYFQGEIFLEEKKFADAYREYETASTIITEPYRLSDILMSMANLKVRAGEQAQAEELGVRIANLLPDQDWRLRDVGNLFLNLNEPAKALPYYEKALEYSHTLKSKAASYSSLADVHNRLGDPERAQYYSRNYIALVMAHQERLTDAETGLAAFYQGEIYNHQGDPRRGYFEYERASRLLDDRYRRSDALLRMAEYQAAHGSREQAVSLAEASEAEVPGEWWKLRQIGEFFLRLNMPDKALGYFKEAAGLDPDSGMAATYTMMADAYRTMGDPERYSLYMREYIQAIREDGRTPSREEEGLAAYYDGEIKRLDGRTGEAFESYQRASELMEDKARLTTAFMAMAEYEAEQGNRESAAAYAERSAEADASTDKLRQVGEFLLRLDMPEKALDYFERYARQLSSVEQGVDVYSIVAENYKRMGNRERYLFFANRYANLVADENEEAFSPANRGLAAFYRGEIATSGGDLRQAYEEYKKASELITEPFRLSETFMRMAESKAALGDNDEAAALAARSADTLPEEPWKLQQVANFLLDLNRYQEADLYIQRYAALSGDAKTQAAMYASWAESFKRSGDVERYLHFAKQFSELVNTGKITPTPTEEGLAAYFAGEVAAAGGDTGAAYVAYEKAARLIDDKDRLYEIYTKMAEHQAELGSTAEAEELVKRSVDGLPLRDYRYRQAADFLTRLGLADAATPYLAAYAGYSGETAQSLSANAAMAELYKERGETKKYLQYAGQYIITASGDAMALTPNEAGLAEFYRGDILSAEGNRDGALEAYQKAVISLTDRNRLAETLEKMAVIEGERGNRARAAELMERAAGLLPNEEWNPWKAAELYGNLGMPEKALELYKQQLANAQTPKARADAYNALAGTYERLGDDAGFVDAAEKYIALVTSPSYKPTRDESGQRAFFQGRLFFRQRELDKAIAAFQEAAKLFTDPYQQSECYVQMGEIEADRGNHQRAAELMEEAIFLVPDNSWRKRQAIDLFSRLGEREAAFRVLAELLDNADSPSQKTAAYADAAELHRRFFDPEGFQRYARLYVDLIAAESFNPARGEIGRAHEYMADIHLAEDDMEQAYTSLEKALDFYDDPGKQSDLYSRMAGLQAELGNNDEAVRLVEKAVSLEPESPWRIMTAAGVFNRAGLQDKAREYYGRSLALAQTPGERAEALSALADSYAGPDREKYIQYAKDYIATVTTPGYAASNNELGRMHFYQAEMYRMDDMADEAIAGYEQAARLVSDTYFQSGILIKIAELEVARGDNEKAAELAEQSLAMFPNDAWKAIEAARIYDSAGMPEKATEILRRLENQDSAAQTRWLIYANLADIYRKTGQQNLYQHYATKYNEAIAQKRNATAAERALGHFYRAELEKEAGNLHLALEQYETALRLYDPEKYRQSEIALKIAEIHARLRNNQKAIEYAEKSVEYMPDDLYRLLAAGDFLLGQKAADKAFHHYFHALELSGTDRTKAVSYESIAKAYRTLDDKEKYLHYASEYYHAVERLGSRATTLELANQAFYLGEMHMLRGNEYQAYLAYERASQLYTDPYLRTEALLPMARYNLKMKNKELAAEQARQVADLLPDQGWRVGDAASVLANAGRKDQSIEVLRRAIDLNPFANSVLYKDLSTTYIQNKDKKSGIKASEHYIDYLLEKAAAGDSADATETLQELWNARQNHGNMLRPFGLTLESYQYLRRYEDGAYSISTTHELQKYYYLNRRLRGKMFIGFEGTLHALNKGKYYYEGGEGEWRAYQRYGEDSTMRFGFSIEPFFEGVLKDLSINFEYLVGIGKNAHHENWRVRAVFDRGIGDEIRPFGTNWAYSKIYAAAVYSLKNDELISYGSARRGHTFAVGDKRRLLIIPYGTVTYSYGGRKMTKGERWGSEIGAGIMFKPYFRESRYHLPLANIEFDFYYHYGLTKNRRNIFGLTIGSNF